MRIRVIASVVLCALSFATTGCRTITEPSTYGGCFSPEDPVARAGTFQYIEQENHQHFDVGVALMRRQGFLGQDDTNWSASAAMAFERGSDPAQAASAFINGVPLTWQPVKANTWYWCEVYTSNSANGLGDSMSFSYRGFDGGSYSATVPVAARFGACSGPDTLSVSKGGTFKYQHAVPGDSIFVSIDGIDIGSYANDTLSFPDTGSFLIPADLLTYSSTGQTNYYLVDVYRKKWQALTSDAEKRIGVYSKQTLSFGFYVKP